MARSNFGRNKTQKHFYDKVHCVPVTDIDTEFTEEKSLNITINNNYNELHIKLRDSETYLFNYNAVIDNDYFQTIRREQNLDIEYNELATHLLDMLATNLEKKLFLKCLISNNASKCQLIFYEKSKIKSLVLLSLELMATNQQELFDEMEFNMKSLQKVNDDLQFQIKNLKEKLVEREDELVQISKVSNELKKKFLNDIKKINDLFLNNLRDCESLIAKRLLVVTKQILKISNDIGLIKTDTEIKCDSSNKILQHLEKLKIEKMETTSNLEKIQIDCANYKKINNDLENELYDLNKYLKEKERIIVEMQEKMDEYRKDLENSAIVIARKTELFEEIRKDLEQANQVIRNYNKHYDMKAEEVEDLKETMKAKDDLIKEQIFQNNQLFKEYHEYQLQYNQEETDKLLVELSTAKNKIELLEKEKRDRKSVV